MKPFRHYILTRFNIGIYVTPTAGKPSPLKMEPEAWMQHRMKLFLTYTLPSMMQQTCQNFTWLIIADQATPDSWKKLFSSIRYPNLHMLYLNKSRGRIRRQILEEMEKGDFAYITTRIDNDDAFQAEAIQKIQQCYMEHSDKALPWAVIFPYGCVYDVGSQKLYLTKHMRNNFPSVISAAEPMSMVSDCTHGQIPYKYQTTYIEGNPYWLMICHDQNLLNHPNPTVVNHILTEKPLPVEYLALFGVLPSAIPQLTR